MASIDNDAFALVVNASNPARTVAELVAHAKANPGKLNMASSGAGNLSHLAGELFRMMSGIQVVRVPYRGAPAANTSVMTGETHLLFNALPENASPASSGATNCDKPSMDLRMSTGSTHTYAFAPPPNII